MRIFLRMLGAGVELGRAKVEHTLESVPPAAPQRFTGSFTALNAVVSGNLERLARARLLQEDRGRHAKASYWGSRSPRRSN